MIGDRVEKPRCVIDAVALARRRRFETSARPNIEATTNVGTRKQKRKQAANLACSPPYRQVELRPCKTGQGWKPGKYAKMPRSHDS
jgi:hypothetical protein